jgi:hypothetical protein
MVELEEANFGVATAGFRDAIAYAKRDRNVGLEHGNRINLIIAELGRGDVQAAARELALDVLPETATINNRASNAWAASKVALASGRAAAAVAAVDRVLAEAPPVWRWMLQTRRGEALYAMGNTIEAERAFADAIATIEAQRAEVDIDELKARVTTERREPFELLFGLQARRGDATAALATAQSATARAIVDGLVAREAGQLATADVIDAASQRIHAVLEVDRALRRSPTSIPIAPGDLLRRVGKRDVLSYFVAGDRVWLIAINDGSAKLHELAIGRRELAAAISAWVRDLDAVEPARMLGDALLPREALPVEGSTIYIAPDGPLHGVPFAALIVDDRRLIERDPIAMIPSVAAMIAQDAQRLADGPAVVVGDPTGDLPGARAEASAVAAAMPDVSPLLGADATIRVVVDRARSARLLHVAAHADIDGFQPSLRLADGPITAGMIIDGGVAPALVILTSCVSAVAPGDDDWGALASSFLAAGSSSVIASLWSIDDAIVRDDVTRLYQLDLRAPARALADVQRQAIRAGRRVTTWAAYVVFGRGESPDIGTSKPGAE